MSDNMQYKQTFTLMQQTPLIHFQYNQAGATLRATEVKPKLDRFIIRKMGGRENIPKKWFLGETNALDYKLRIVADNTTRYELGQKKDYNIYYGNIGGQAKEGKDGIMSDAITLTVVCFIPKLMEEIKKRISEFFIVTNFGTMQNKGFGSFLVDKIPAPSVISAALRAEYGAKCCYSFQHGGRPFPKIKDVYSIMKSGINHGGYQRSLLFLYMHEKYRLGNEKAWLKKNKMAPALGKNAANSDDREVHEFRYVRALLGVGDHLEFKNSQNRNDRSKTTIDISGMEENGKEKVERLGSSVFFKVIGENVYIVGKRIHPEIYDRDFLFSEKKKTGYDSCSSFHPEKSEGILKTPSENAFDIDDFLAYCVKKLNGADAGMTDIQRLAGLYGRGIREVK